MKIVWCKIQYFFLHDSDRMWPCIIMEKHKVFLLMSAGCFLRRYSCTRYSCWEYKFALSFWLWFKKSKMNNAKVIPPYTQNNFSSIKFSLWNWLQRFIQTNPFTKPFTLNIFHHLLWYSWETGHKWICDFPYSSHYEYEETKCPTCSLFLGFFFSSGGTFLIGLCGGQVLILKYYYADWIPQILLKCL